MQSTTSNLDRREALMSHTITVSPKPASEAGALDGHKYVCSCGATQGTSLGEREARTLGFKHLEWHRSRKGA